MSQPDQANLFVPDLAELIPEVPEKAITSRSLYRDDTVRAVLFRFAAGETLSEHTSSRPAILHFLDGSAAITLGRDAHQVAAGAWMHMPAHLPHSIEALTPVTMLLLILESG